MAKSKTVFYCTACGYEISRWQGRCENCGAWNTFEERPKFAQASSSSVFSATREESTPMRLNSIEADNEVRYHTGISELDRLLGGGIVNGSLLLLGGDPGIGKSTLLLQICAALSKEKKILYVSGEESVRQLKLRADRLEVTGENLFLLSENDYDVISQTVLSFAPDMVMIDSIQTMKMNEIQSSCGSITQVRECTNGFMRIAKTQNIPILIVGHVNKDGNIAGPKVLEHIVDAVLYFEGDRHFTFRILRAVKNRYGSTNEIAVFDMGDRGLVEVKNPSEMLLKERPSGVSGSCVCSILEGSRPIMAEVQALVTKTGFGTPRRVCTGFDYNRMSLILAVLEKRAGYLFGSLDTYINVVGGLRLDEPGADLSIALALVSGVRDRPLDEHLIAFGEIGLGGELRSVSGIERRIKEAQKLGFTKCILPAQGAKFMKDYQDKGLEICPTHSVRQAIQLAFG